MAINKNTFFINTFCDFKKIKSSEIPKRNPDFASKSGSMYWYEKGGVIRKSDHWGRTISTCNWLLDGCAKKGLSTGFALFSSFKKENLSLLKEGSKFKVTKTVLTRNGGGCMDIETQTGIFKGATSDYYLFDKFKIGRSTIAAVEKAK